MKLMKKIIISLLLLFTSFSIAASQPYKYSFLLDDQFDYIQSMWSLANWTFAENSCEFSPDNVYAENDQLVLKISAKGSDDRGQHPAKDYFGGEIYSNEEHQYGKYFIKMKPNSKKGVITSFFLIHIDFDDNYKPLDWAEIDFEFVGRTDRVQLNLRWMEDDSGQIKDKPVMIKLDFDASKQFHGYLIEWTPTYINFLIDGKIVYSCTDENILRELSKPMSIRMNYWISNSPYWAGVFDDGDLPLKTHYKDLAVKQLNR